MVFVDFVDSADVRMVEGRSSARLALETLQRMPIDSGIFRKELQCDQAAQSNVFGLIDHSHTARAQLFLNTIVRDGLLVHDAQNSSLGALARMVLSL